MSKTFYIKKTAFDDIGVGSPPSVDIAESELNSFIIGPGELNGPAGLNRDSDLELYGFGALKWGEGVNQNQYRQLENFACPQKETGDYWAAGSPPENAYDSTIHPIAPKDENDLGIGNGITTPLKGQSWYNATDKTLYTFGDGSPATEWRSDMSATNVLNMVGYGIINLLDPRDAPTDLQGSPAISYPQDAVTVGWADLRFVNLTGDTMTGILDMGTNQIINLADPTDTSNTLQGSITEPNDAVVVGWADNRYVNLTGDTMTGILDMGTNKIENVGNAVAGTDVVNRDTGDGRYVTQELDSDINSAGTTLLTVHNLPTAVGASTITSGLEINQIATGSDAFVSFNEAGSQFNFGRDGATNDLFVGGGSMGATKHKVWHAGNDGSGSGLDADTLRGNTGSSFLSSTFAHTSANSKGLTTTIMASSPSVNLTAGDKYLIIANGITHVRGTGTSTLFAALLYKPSGAVYAQITNNVSINWPDGNAPISVSYVFTPDTSGAWRVRFDSHYFASSYSVIKLEHIA